MAVLRRYGKLEAWLYSRKRTSYIIGNDWRYWEVSRVGRAIGQIVRDSEACRCKIRYLERVVFARRDPVPELPINKVTWESGGRYQRNHCEDA